MSDNVTTDTVNPAGAPEAEQQVPVNTIRIRRTRWKIGATPQEIQDAAEEGEVLSELLADLLLFFNSTEQDQVETKAHRFMYNLDATPMDGYQAYSEICNFGEEHTISMMQVGDSVFAKFQLYWLPDEEEAAYIFEYGESR